MRSTPNHTKSLSTKARGGNGLKNRSDDELQSSPRKYVFSEPHPVSLVWVEYTIITAHFPSQAYICTEVSFGDLKSSSISKWEAHRVIVA